MKHIVVLAALIGVTSLLAVPTVQAGCCSGRAPLGCSEGYCLGSPAYGPPAGSSAACCGPAGPANAAYGQRMRQLSAPSGLPPCCQVTKQVAKPRVQARGPVRGSDISVQSASVAATGPGYPRNATLERAVKPSLPACCNVGSGSSAREEKEPPLLAVLLGGFGKETEQRSVRAGASDRSVAPGQPRVAVGQPAVWNGPAAAPARLTGTPSPQQRTASLPSCCAPGPGLVK